MNKLSNNSLISKDCKGVEVSLIGRYLYDYIKVILKGTGTLPASHPSSNTVTRAVSCMALSYFQFK